MFTLGTIHILHQQEYWMGSINGSACWPSVLCFTLTWFVGGSGKVQKCTDVIYGWPLRELIKVLVKRKFHDESIYWCDRFLKCCDHSDKRIKRNVLTTLMLNYWSIGNYEKVLKLGHETFAIPLGQFICHKNMWCFLVTYVFVTYLFDVVWISF